MKDKKVTSDFETMVTVTAGVMGVATGSKALQIVPYFIPILGKVMLKICNNVGDIEDELLKNLKEVINKTVRENIPKDREVF